MNASNLIASPDDPLLDELCAKLAERSADLDRTGEWPAEQLALLARYGVTRWFVPRAWGGTEWSERQILRGYLKLSAACLTTAFILTQRSGACGRIAASDSEAARERWLPGLASGELFATVGISHLTTSRRHLARPALVAARAGDDYVLDGSSPWVTGGAQADVIAVGAVQEDGRQLLFAVPGDLPGVRAAPPASLVGLSASHTCQVDFDSVRVPSEALLLGPAENVMRIGAGTGGLPTSVLAAGLGLAAIEFLSAESQARPDLAPAAHSLRAEQRELADDLIGAAEDNAAASPAIGENLRARANSLALRATQAALAAAKGTGYVAGHPAGRWCREALFFLVWSCPQPVMNANLCEWAGL